MRKFLIGLLLILITVSVVAREKEDVMTAYQDNYFLFGDNEHQTKFQISAKFNLIYPSETGLYGAFTMKTHWFVYGRDTMFSTYMPEVLYRFESGKNLFNDFVIPYIDFIQISPECHNSTGIEDPSLHRSVNMYYAQAQTSIGDVYNFGINLKIFGYYNMDAENLDINKYKKNYEADIFFKLKSKTVQYLDKEEFHCKFTGNPIGNGSFTLEAKFRILTSRVEPKIFIQYCRGYGEFMVDYNKKDEVVRAGLVFDGQ